MPAPLAAQCVDVSTLDSRAAEPWDVCLKDSEGPPELSLSLDSTRGWWSVPLLCEKNAGVRSALRRR